MSDDMHPSVTSGAVLVNGVSVDAVAAGFPSQTRKNCGVVLAHCEHTKAVGYRSTRWHPQLSPARLHSDWVAAVRKAFREIPQKSPRRRGYRFGLPTLMSADPNPMNPTVSGFDHGHSRDRP
ncbi:MULTISPECIES: hypothetical protein [Nocardiaceae]|uniref:hypothetical protein n=1 Tax=Nocardiaceae TaxID=85025 RepID=UPI001F3D7F0E|nr:MULTISPECIES: hypothetical protein [Rhodococcus]